MEMLLPPAPQSLEHRRRREPGKRLDVRWPWDRKETHPTPEQTLRAFIQINVLPKPR